MEKGRGFGWKRVGVEMGYGWKGRWGKKRLMVERVGIERGLDGKEVCMEGG